MFFSKSVRSFALQKLLSFFLHFFSANNISVFDYKVLKHLTSRPLNELIKLMILRTTGPSYVNPFSIVGYLC